MAALRRAAFAEEAAEVEVLHANLDKMKSLSKKIQGSMNRLEVSGRTVQDAIGPVYGNTQKLQVMNTNVDKVLQAIERAREPLDMTKREERILKSRPDKVGLADYISSVDRTNQALQDLKTSNMRSNQQAITDLNNLLQTGSQSLEEVFRDMCRRESQPIEPLGYIMKASDFPRFSVQKSTQLRTINTHIHNAAHTSPGELSPAAKIYAIERGQYISSSLQGLSAACLSTARKVSGQDPIYQKGTNGIAAYAEGMLSMFIAEYDNISQIFTREESGIVLSATCQTTVAVFSSTLLDLDSHIKANLFTDCYLAYEIVDVVSNTTFQLEQRTGQLKEEMIEALKPVRETAKASLSTLLNDTRSRVQQMPSLPGDGSAVPLTAEVMQRLQLMSSYLPPLSSIMRSLGAGGWAAPDNSSSTNSVPTLKSFDVGADGKLLFSHYCNDSIETLLSNLEGRSRVLLRGKSLQGVFMANNVAIVDRMIRSSELNGLLGNMQSKLDSWKKKASQMYTDPWAREVSNNLLDSLHTSKQPRPPSGGGPVDSAAILKSMSKKDKEGIQEKFRLFNLSFDDLVAKHKSFKMEPEVRRQLGKDVQTLIEPLYSRFWERYHDIDKGKGKYVKYDKSQLSSILASLS